MQDVRREGELDEVRRGRVVSSGTVGVESQLGSRSSLHRECESACPSRSSQACASRECAAHSLALLTSLRCFSSACGLNLGRLAKNKRLLRRSSGASLLGAVAPNARRAQATPRSDSQVKEKSVPQGPGRFEDGRRDRGRVDIGQADYDRWRSTLSYFELSVKKS